MDWENSHICSVRITGKRTCETFPPSLHDLIISPHVKHPPPPINLPKRVCFPMQSLFKKNPPHTFWGGHTMFYLHIFPISKSFILTFVLQTMALQARLPSQCVFKVVQYGYETFQTVLSLNCKNHIANKI